jgi:hypothetical protein
LRLGPETPENLSPRFKVRFGPWRLAVLYSSDCLFEHLACNGCIGDSVRFGDNTERPEAGSDRTNLRFDRWRKAHDLRIT